MIRYFFFFLLTANTLAAQFAPPAGQVGSTAIHKDSSIFVAWATAATIERGPMDISNPALGLASTGDASAALGAAGDGQIVSLGDGGSAMLTFAYPIRNSSGFDFAIFENAFNDSFLELGFVEVSSDGVRFVRFPSISNNDTSVQIGSFGVVDATKIHNLAGKYRAGYGTPFDLEDLADSSGLDLEQITHIRIVDAVGCVQPAYATRDSRGVIINDIWNTPFASSGFDLDAIGVIHQNTNIAVQKIADLSAQIYPNPVAKGQAIFIDIPAVAEYQIQLYSPEGRLLKTWANSPQMIPTQDLYQGLFLLKICSNLGIQTKRFVIW